MDQVLLYDHAVNQFYVANGAIYVFIVLSMRKKKCALSMKIKSFEDNF